VLLDAKRHFDAEGTPFLPDRRFPIGGRQLEAIAASERVEVRPGDILLLRTGWLAWLRSLDSDTRERMRGTVHPREGGLQSPGLDPSAATAAWLWDHGVVGVAADNHALETLQIRADEGFGHRRILALLGMPIGEYFDLEELAADCAADGVYEFLLVASPLNLPGGVGSPANAYAIK
jgi:kynurenine formamidase